MPTKKVVVYKSLKPGFVTVKLGGDTPFLEIKSKELSKTLEDWAEVNNFKDYEIVDKTNL